MNVYLILILLFLVGKYSINLLVEAKNLKALESVLPEEFKGTYSEQKYQKSQSYLRENTKVTFFQDSYNILLMIPFILLGGFNLLDRMVRGLNYNSIATGIIFTFALIIIPFLLNLPFNIYTTFVTEEKYGFNKTTLKTFILDLVKSLGLLFFLGTPLLYAVLMFFEKTGKLAPLYIWITITVFQLFLTYIAPVVIMPLFNKFIPLEEGELRNTIEEYSKKHDFKLKGIFKMDGSKRSTKSNAFFTGFGASKRIVLFDTLIEKHTVDELLTVLAHEVGHYKLKHILKRMMASILETGLLLFILSLFLNNSQLFEAFKMEQLSVYASLIFFGFLYAPLSLLSSLISNYFSRKHEFAADKYAVNTSQKPEVFIDALKKLSVDNLSNLTPHKLKVLFSYSHPPVLERIRAIRKL